MSDINFVTVDVETILSELISDFEEYTGETLYPADPRRTFLQGFAYVLAGIRSDINTTGRSNLLRYATGTTLDALGERYGAERLAAGYATATIKFTLSAVQSSIITIPAGTRVTPDGKLFFATTAALSISIGATEGSVTAQATVAGIAYNGFTAGQISKLVDGNAYVSTVANTTTSSGGSDIETDDDYRARLLLAPYKLTTAGPSQSYKYYALSASSDIGDVSVYSSSPGRVTIAVIKKDGVIPTAIDEVITAVENVCTPKSVRPLTDGVTVIPAVASNTTINATYYINSDDLSSLTTIQTAVAAAVEDYKTWQYGKIGRDINPDKLRLLILNAGAARVDITTPVYTSVGDNEVAQFTSTIISYGGTIVE